MSTQVKNLALAKIATAVVAVAMIAGMLFAFATPRAQAVTLSELVELFIALDIISGDKADEARAVLSNQGGGTTSSGGSTAGGYTCNGTFTRSLTVGDTGSDVMWLQQFLNSMPATQVASVGAGSPGAETDYYGGRTGAAVKKFQEMYAAEILAPIGLVSGTTFFGPATMAKANAICAGGGGTTGGGTTGGGDVPPPPPPAPGGVGDDDDDDDDDDDNGGSSSSGSNDEASLEDYDKLGDPSDEELEEGDEDVAVFGFEFDVEDGDASVRRVDVVFQGQSNSSCSAGAGVCEDEPWRALEDVSLWFDGEKISTENADDEDDWEDLGSDQYRMRFSGLDVDLNEGDTAEFLVGVTVSGGIDGTDLDQTWRVWVPASGLRALDGANVDQFTGSNSETEDFTIEEVGADAELNVRLDSSNPDESTIKVDSDSDTDGVTVLVFNVEAEDGEVTLNELPFTIETGSSTVSYDDVIADVEIEIDGTLYDDINFTKSTDGSTSTTHLILDLEDDDDEIDFEEDEKFVGKVILDLKEQAQATYGAGAQIKASITSDDVSRIDAEKADGDNIATSNLEGSALGDFHTLIAEGVFAEIVSTDADLIAAQFSGDDEKGDYQIKFDVTAFEEDAYISRSGFGDTALSGTSSGVVYAIENNAGSAVSTSSSASLSSTADTDSNNTFVVREGDTETFTLDITFNPDIGGFYRAQLLGVNFDDNAAGAAAGAGNSHVASPDEDFETDSVDIDA